jgi:3-deoxy-D-manno-octulosonic-acid transferase
MSLLFRALYSLFFVLLVPLVMLRLWRRGQREHGYRKHIGERFGGKPIARGHTGVVWIHAVSVGEARAAIPLINQLRREVSAPIIVTCMTPSGRAVAREQLPDDVMVGYLPYDLPWVTSRFVKRMAPKILIIMETELWPNLLAACKQQHVPTVLVNARLSEKSQRGYAKFYPVRSMAREALSSFSAIFAQSPADQARFIALGAATATTTVVGNVKFDMPEDAAAIARGRAWKATLGTRQVLLFASTREHEELPLLDAFLAHRDWPQERPLLVVVPRHPSRFNEIYALLEQRSLKTLRRTNLDDTPDSETIAAAEAWLGDSMGEMQSYYAMCDVAVIGGSFKPLGGQNLIEASALGKPVIMGPSTFNFSHAVAIAREARAMVSVKTPTQAMTEAARLLADAPAREAMGARGSAFAAAHRGATQRTMDAITALLARSEK